MQNYQPQSLIKASELDELSSTTDFSAINQALICAKEKGERFLQLKFPTEKENELLAEFKQQGYLFEPTYVQQPSGFVGGPKNYHSGSKYRHYKAIVKSN